MKKKGKVEKSWERKDLKSRAKLVIKKNLWTLLFVGILMTSILGEYTATRNSNERLETISKYIQAIHDGKESEISIKKRGCNS